MKTYSIKLVDGNRYDFSTNDDDLNPVEQIRFGVKLIRVPESNSVTRYFIATNIVSIKEVQN